jgi:hypothetical protein
VAARSGSARHSADTLVHSGPASKTDGPRCSSAINKVPQLTDAIQLDDWNVLPMFPNTCYP